MPTRCALTFDFDAMSVWLGSYKTRNPSMVSRGEFGAIAVPRILDLLGKHRLPGTFCIPGHTALAYPDIVKRIRDEGHEIVHHGWVHENPAEFDEAGERENIEKGLEALHKAAGVRPKGYRSPSWDFSERTIKILLDYGFSYDSSLMGSDFIPYYARIDDRFDRMIGNGALEEVRRLAALGLDPALPAMKAIGVPELQAVLAGELDAGDAIAHAKIATRQYAKRQATWFRHQLGPEWARLSSVDEAETST